MSARFTASSEVRRRAAARTAVRFPTLLLRLSRVPAPRGQAVAALAKVSAAGAAQDIPLLRKTASELTGILLALVPLKAVPAIGRLLTAELRRTVGEHGSPTQF
jgi:hypothetical protein